MDAAPAPLAAGSVDYARERERPALPGGNRVCWAGVGHRWETLEMLSLSMEEILKIQRHNIHCWMEATSWFFEQRVQPSSNFDKR